MSIFHVCRQAFHQNLKSKQILGHQIKLTRVPLIGRPFISQQSLPKIYHKQLFCETLECSAYFQNQFIIKFGLFSSY